MGNIIEYRVLTIFAQDSHTLHRKDHSSQDKGSVGEDVMYLIGGMTGALF